MQYQTFQKALPLILVQSLSLHSCIWESKMQRMHNWLSSQEKSASQISRSELMTKGLYLLAHWGELHGLSFWPALLHSLWSLSSLASPSQRVSWNVVCWLCLLLLMGSCLLWILRRKRRKWRKGLFLIGRKNSGSYVLFSYLSGPSKLWEAGDFLVKLDDSFKLGVSFLYGHHIAH